jgi:hypothetical protein
MRTSRWVYVSCALLVLALVSPSVLLAQNRCFGSADNELDGSIRKRLDVAASNLTSAGFELTDTYPGLISEGAVHVLTVELTRGRSYGLVAVCEYCSGLDLALYDKDNVLIAPSLAARGNHTDFTVIPRRTGPYKLVLRMTSCNQGSCYYGISVLERSACPASTRRSSSNTDAVLLCQ